MAAAAVATVAVHGCDTGGISASCLIAEGDPLIGAERSILLDTLKLTGASLIMWIVCVLLSLKLMLHRSGPSGSSHGGAADTNASSAVGREHRGQHMSQANGTQQTAVPNPQV